MSEKVKRWLIERLLDSGIPFEKRIMLMELAAHNPDVSLAVLQDVMLEQQKPKSAMRIETMGVIGNVWVRQQFWPEAGDYHQGHKHHHDHLSLVTAGRIMVKVEGHEPKEYAAASVDATKPSYFIVDKDTRHHLIALEPNTVTYCIFALRDEDGNVSDFYNGDESPYGTAK